MLYRFGQVIEERKKELPQVGVVSCGTSILENIRAVLKSHKLKPHDTSKALTLGKFAQ